ncbi:MBL fold metallo-hydrolase [Laspinema sp. D1]|uniref:MBL fold metallo-hydrolase n=1 Tax=Laspinema palackyanum D2a TaxID=2953684 RepID=A0ABT2MX69_9CYAN|nr:MBL fold metallo-hydrolase [Laspinema sp. D2a]
MDQLECLPYSVGHGDEGVSLQVRMGPYRILLDCGIRDISPLQAGLEPKGSGPGSLPADLVLVSHAHADHARGLWDLHQAFPQLPIYASEVTTELLPLNWPEGEGDRLRFCQALPWRTPVEFLDGLTAELFPAGHLPGAAAILLSYTPTHTGRSPQPPRPYTLLYTGDFFLSNSRLVEGLPLDELRGLDPDVLIVEGSYGTSRFPHRRSQENQLAERIERAIAQGQSVLLPTPTVGLGQEILMLLRSHHQFTGRDLDIWVEGTVADACDIYLELLPQLPASVQNFARHQPLFWDERIRPRVRRLFPEHHSELANGPCVLLTELSSNLKNFEGGDRQPWLILLPEYPGQPQRYNPESLFGHLPKSRFTLETYLLAQHCDGNSTTQLIHNLHPQHVVFIHGSPAYLADLTNLDELRNRYHLHTPEAGNLVELPIGETILQPATPAEIYPGELTEHPSSVTLSLTQTLALDPRWQKFSDTGLIEARWQGEELVVRGVSQRELLSQGSAARVSANIECCGNCRYYRGQRCWNQVSPLFGFKVTPDGYCPAFEAAMVPPVAPPDS